MKMDKMLVFFILPLLFGHSEEYAVQIAGNIEMGENVAQLFRVIGQHLLETLSHKEETSTYKQNEIDVSFLAKKPENPSVLDEFFRQFSGKNMEKVFEDHKEPQRNLPKLFNNINLRV